jgi:hypothetical protein
MSDDRRGVLEFVGKATVSRITETTKIKKDASVEETTTYQLQLEDDDGRRVAFRQGVPFNVRPGEWLKLAVTRTQTRLDAEAK